MNILIVNKYYFISGGPERYLFAVKDLLEGEGHKVIPLTMQLDRNEPSPYAADFLPPPFSNAGASHFQQASPGLFEKIKLSGRAIYYPTARRRVAELVRREKIDLVYLLNICNYISPSVIDGARDGGARVVMRLSDFNFICASYHFFRDGQVCTACQQGLYHALKYRCMRGSLALSLSRVLAMKIHQLSGIYQKVNAFVAPSRFMADVLVQAGMPQARVHWVPSFVDLGEYEPAFTPGDYVLYFGRLDAEKGVDLLLRAWQALGSDAPPLRIVGSGEAEAELKTLAETLQVSNVTFHDFVEKDTLLGIIRGAAFVVVPSLWHDNAPMAVYEAMACGKAVVGSRLGGLIDQIEDQVSGLLVPPGEPDRLAQGVAALWGDQARLEAWGRAARQRMETLFSPANHMAALARIFGINQTANYKREMEPHGCPVNR